MEKSTLEEIAKRNKEFIYIGIGWGFGIALGYLILMGALLS